MCPLLSSVENLWMLASFPLALGVLFPTSSLLLKPNLPAFLHVWSLLIHLCCLLNLTLCSFVAFSSSAEKWVWGTDETKNWHKDDFFPSRFFVAPAWTDLLFFSVSLHLAAPNWPSELLILTIVLALPFESSLNPDAVEGYSRRCSWWQQEEQRHSWCFGIGEKRFGGVRDC